MSEGKSIRKRSLTSFSKYNQLLVHYLSVYRLVCIMAKIVASEEIANIGRPLLDTGEAMAESEQAYHYVSKENKLAL